MTTTTLTLTPPCGPVHGWADGQVIRATGIPAEHLDQAGYEPAPWHPLVIIHLDNFRDSDLLPPPRR